MKFSYNWLSELVEGLDLAPAELSRSITLKTAESEGVEPAGAVLDKVCAARVLSVEQIRDSHNVKVTVDTGRYGLKTVVCGAPNVRVGITTAYVPAGVTLGGKEIRAMTIGGVSSDGMLASGAELGLNRDSTGILHFEANPGDPIPGCQPDAIIEIDNKSITNRPDLWGHYGMAREVAAITGKCLLDPVRPLPSCPPPPLRIEIPDLDLCPRYSALVFENVTVKESPLWLQYRLEAIGLNPINNIVDVTNFVMSDLAQPMHAFDQDKLAGDTIWARPGREGETIVALNGEKYDVDPSTVVIADAQGPIAIGGVIGGLDSSITPETRRIVLESACFHPASIRKTSVRLKLRTDASMRFEKSQDPENTLRGLARALQLLEQVSPGIRLIGGPVEKRRPLTPPAPILVPVAWLERKLGVHVETARVRSILESLQFGVEEVQPGVLQVAVPSWRATKDISVAEDLVEEVGRMIGYGEIPPVAPLVRADPPPVNEDRRFHHQVRRMVSAQGFTEVYNYSFISEDLARRFGFEPEAHLRVANPISTDQTLMRTSLVPGVWRNIVENAKNFETFRLFEIGHEIRPGADRSRLPREVPKMLAAMFVRDSGEGALFELKRVAECLMPGAEVRPAGARGFEHPARAAEVLWRGEVVGRLFELHPSLLETGRASVLDVDLEAIMRLRPSGERYKQIRRYPASAFDLSVIAKTRELVGDIEKLLRSFAGERLEKIEFVRQYSGAPLEEGWKSVSFRLTVAASDRTLSSDEVASIRASVIEGMRGQGYELRV